MNLVKKVYDLTASKIKQYPCHVNRASNLGHECLRHLVYCRTNWQNAEPVGVELQRIFDQGNMEETAIIRELLEAGVSVAEQQMTLWWEEYKISGHMDLSIVEQEEAGQAMLSIPCEIKSANPNIFSSLFYRGAGVYEWEEVEAAFQKKPWTRKYLAQLQVYMLMKNIDRGYFLFKDKSSGAIAQVNVKLDYEYAESLLQKAELINKHVDDGTLPDPIAFDDQVCGMCQHRMTCCPDKMEDPLRFIDESIIEEALKTREAAEEAGKVYKQLDKRVKDWMKAQPGDRLVVGKFLLQKKPHGNGIRVHIERYMEETE